MEQVASSSGATPGDMAVRPVCSLVMKNRAGNIGSGFELEAMRFNLQGLEPELLHQLPSLLGLHEHGSAIAAGTRLKLTNAKLAAAILAFELNLETTDAAVGKKIFQHHYGLGPAVAVGFIGQGTFDFIIHIARKLLRIA